MGVKVPVCPPRAHPMPPCCNMIWIFDVPFGATYRNWKTARKGRGAGVGRVRGDGGGRGVRSGRRRDAESVCVCVCERERDRRW